MIRAGFSLLDPQTRRFIPSVQNLANVTSVGSPAPVEQAAAKLDSDDVKQITGRLDKSTQQANQANARRYRQLLDAVEQTQKRVMGSQRKAQKAVAGVGKAGRQRIEDDRIKQLAQVRQFLISSGLGNTTVQQTAHRGVTSDAERAQQSLDERMALLQSGLLQQQAGSQFDLGRFQADALLSRVDAPPAVDLYLQLLQQIAGA